MKKIIIFTICLSSFLFSQVSVKHPIKKFNVQDQFAKYHQITKNTKKIIFAFKKSSGHLVKDFLVTKKPTYLSKKDILFVADVSAMPSFIKFFVLPITGYDFPIVTLDDEKLSKYYKNEKYIEKIMIVTLNSFFVTKIDYIDNIVDLQRIIEK